MTDTNAAARADIAKLERTLLRDIAGIRGTLPPALAAVENFIEEWLRDTYQYNWVQQLVPYCDPPPMQFYDAYDKWRAGQPREEWLENQPPHELDDPVERLFWDADAWNSMPKVHQWRLPARDLDEAAFLGTNLTDHQHDFGLRHSGTGFHLMVTGGGDDTGDHCNSTTGSG